MRQKPQPANPEQLRKLDRLARLMDAQFSLPGTNIRFGLDGLIGLIPGAGDLITLAISGYLVTSAARNGASSYVLARMILNTAIDAIIGAIPFFGDLFDFAFKANMRNVRLLRQHYAEGRHRGSARKVIIPIVLLFVVLFAVVIWLLYKVVVWVVG